MSARGRNRRIGCLQSFAGRPLAGFLQIIAAVSFCRWIRVRRSRALLIVRAAGETKNRDRRNCRQETRMRFHMDESRLDFLTPQRRNSQQNNNRPANRHSAQTWPVRCCSFVTDHGAYRQNSGCG